MATLTLPYPGMDFVPLDILTAAEQDQLVANIEATANFCNGLATGDNMVEWQNYNPVGGGITASSYIGRYWQVGKTVTVFIRVNVTNISGNYIIIKLPKPVKGGGIGTCFPASFNDGSSSYKNYQGMANLVGSEGKDLRLLTKYNESVDSSKPFTWTNGDSINLTATYETT